MAASKKKPIRTVWYDGDTPFEDLAPSKQVAHEIVEFHRDLAPSVDRIMRADLTEPQRHHAIGLFQTALSVEGDPHRDPRAAIAAASD